MWDAPIPLTVGSAPNGVAALGGGGVGDAARLDDLQVGPPACSRPTQPSRDQDRLELPGLGVVDAAAERGDPVRQRPHRLAMLGHGPQRVSLRLEGLGRARTPLDQRGVCGMIARWWAPTTGVGHALLIPASRRDSETFPQTMRLIDGHS